MESPRQLSSPHGPALAPGEIVAGRFRVERLAGVGGMGEVFRASDLESGAPVAVKVSRQTVADEARFLREAQLLETLSDPGIVAYLGHGRLADGRPFLAMEWLEGESLADRLARAPLPLEEVVPIVRSVARALGAAHRRGVVHRDVKPSNVFLVSDDKGPRVRLIDFGIARDTGIRGGTLTKTDAAIGTPQYMAPEQVRGARDVGPAADVFSLGCLLYECVAGRGPFVSDTLLAALAAVLLEDPEPLRKHAPAASPELERLTLTMLSKDPAQRPSDGDAVVAALDRLDEMTTSSSIRKVLSETTAGLSRREQRLVLVLVALPSEERRAVEATQRADEPDPTTLRLRSIVERSEGRVELSAEGALVASFLDEGSTRDRVERAIRCARRVQQADPGARVGLVAGRAVSGRVPVGEAVERAILIARSAGASGAGGIGLDDDVATFAAAEHVLDRASSSAGEPFARLGSSRGVETLGVRRARLFGRDRELAALTSSAHESIEEPVARILLLSGEPGIGRTTLLEHFVARLATERAEREPEGPALRVVRVRAQPSDHEAPLALALRIVRAAAGVEEGEPLALRRERLAAHVGALGAPPARAVELVRDLGDLARIPVDSELREDIVRGDSFLRGDLERRAFHEWMTLLARRVVVVAVDDAHHADPTSLELLGHAVERLATRPLVVLLTERVDAKGERTPLERDLARLEPELHRLSPLLPRASRALVEHLLADVPGVGEEARAEIVLRGEGSPFFLRELSAAKARGADAPISILAAVEERILRSSEETRRALRAVALLGEPSALEEVRDLVPGLDEAELRARLDELARAELVELEGSGSALRVRPRSALVTDAAYAMIPEEDRRLAHRGAGLGLRARGAEPARVAHHLERGGELVGAAEAYRDAADRALEAHDLPRAEAHAAHGFELAARALPADADRARALSGELALCRAQAARWSGDYAAAFHRAEEAIACLEPVRGAGPLLAHRFIEALGVSIAASSALGRTEPIERAETQLLASPEPVSDDRDATTLEVVTLCRGAAAWLGHGERARADRWLARAQQRAGDTPLPLASAWLHVLDASRALHDGDLAAFLVDTERAVGEYERAGDARNACNQRVRLANALVSVGELGRAEPLLVAARDDAERMSLSLIAGYAVQNLGHVRSRLGRDAEARACLEDALARARRLGDVQLLAGAHLYLALLELGRDPASSLAHATSACGALSARGPFHAIARAIEARAAVLSGDLPRAQAASTDASEWLQAHGPIEEGEASIHRARADVLLASGDLDGARVVARRAVQALETRAAALPSSMRAGYLEGHPDHVRLRALAGG